MLTRIELENFKGAGNRARIDLKPITLLFGANSSGKSTFLHALHYAYELFVRGNANVSRTTRGGETVNLGGFRSVVHGQSLIKATRIRLDFSVSGDLLEYTEPFSGIDEDDGSPDEEPRLGYGLYENKSGPEDPHVAFLRALASDISRLSYSASVEARIRWSSVRGTAVVDRYRVRLNGRPLATVEAPSDGKNPRLVKLNLAHPLLTGEQFVAEGEDPYYSLSEVLGGAALFGERGGLGIGGTIGAMPMRSGDVWFQPPESVDPMVWAEVARVLRLLLVGPLEVLREQLEGLRYLGPLRCIPPRSYEALSLPEESRWANGMAAWEMLRVDASLRRATSKWLSDPSRLNTGYRLLLRDLAPLGVVVHTMAEGAGAKPGGKAPGRRATSNKPRGETDDLVNAIRAKVATSPGVLRSELVLRPTAGAGSKRLNLHPHDVGVGISQVVPVVAAALSGSVTAQDGRNVKASLVMIEQPELHVHPAMQVALGDLFISARKSRQFLIETHSEHLVLRLLRRMRETATTGTSKAPGKARVSPEDIAIYYLEIAEEGRLTVTPLRVDEHGDFMDLWPRGFFEERLREVL